MADRSARQQVGIERWLATGASATWEWATGMGKTFTALHVIQRTQQSYPEATSHIVVPTLYLQAQFHTALAKSGLKNVQVFVINTYIRQPRICDLLIADEVHLFLGEYALHFPKLFTGACIHRWFLGLSATLTPEERLKLTQLGSPVCDTITLTEAQANGWVAKCKTYNLGVNLSFSEMESYKKWNDIFNSNFARFGHDFQLAMQCVGDRTARLAYAQRMGWMPEHGKADRWSPTTLGAAANMWLRATRERQNVVNHAAAKYQATIYLLNKFPVKAICFSESTDFASELASFIPSICRAYHSNIPSATEEYTVTKSFKTKPDVVTQKTRAIGPDTIRKKSLADFTSENSPIRVLSAAKALDQGADFSGLQLGIETSGNSSIRQKVQRTGRVVRIDNSKPIEEQLAVYIHIYAKSTYEEGKLRRKQKGLTNIHEVTDINDISF